MLERLGGRMLDGHRQALVAVNGFLLDMPRLFEDFVTVALREALEAGYGGRVDDQVRSSFDQAGRVVLRPDIVWQASGAAAAVADAKYKAEKPLGYPNADLYQLLAYCTVLGCGPATSSTRPGTRNRPGASSGSPASRSCATRWISASLRARC